MAWIRYRARTCLIEQFDKDIISEYININSLEHRESFRPIYINGILCFHEIERDFTLIS